MLSLPSGERVSGTSPLQLRTSVSAGTLTLRVAGAKKTTFVLTVSYPKSGAGTATRRGGVKQ